MQFKTPEDEYLLKLFSAAINANEVPLPPDGLDWRAFIALAKKQQVYAVIAPVLDGVDMPDDQRSELRLYNQNELLRLIAMKNEQETLETELEKHAIKYMLLKGGVIRNYYPKSKMRQMADIDILYDKSKKDELYDIMKAHGYTVYSCSENSDDFTKDPFYTFEFHRELFYKEHSFYCDFSYVWDNAVKSKGSDYKYEMSKEDLYLHSIAHMNKHYKYGGFGVRFLADTYLLLTNDSQGYDKAYIEKKLNEFKLTEFEEFIRKLSLALFIGDNLDEKQIDFMNKMLDFGIYGDGTGVTVYYDEYLKKAGKKASPTRFFLSKLFPSAEFMKRNYKILNKKPYLLPAYYIYRLIYKPFHTGKKNLREYRVLKKYAKGDN